MSGMSVSIPWSDIAIRLVLTVVAALALGFNRSEYGKAAGMRTLLLVCLAASVAMIQVNLLLPTAGRPSDSFVMNDLMRLPLGILTGVGFIGGGVILRRGDIVTGVTTAATLWLATVIGLCFGGGQNELGLAATALGLCALWPLGRLERLLPRRRTAMVTIEFDDKVASVREIRDRIAEAGFSIAGAAVSVERASRRKFEFRLHYIQALSHSSPPPLVDVLATEPGVERVEWRDAAGLMAEEA
jgi:putative Mg2+ transporter-C (MgtC) family protein